MKDKRMIVELLKKTVFEHEWEGYQSMLQLTLAILAYFSRTEEIFGKSAGFIYVPIENGLMRGLLPAKNYEEFGIHLTKYALDPKKLDEWCLNFKKVADEVRGEMDTSADLFIQNIQKIQDLQYSYLAYQSAAKTVSNFLPESTDKKVFESLEGARKYSEDFFKISNKKLVEIGGLLQKELPAYTGKEFQFITLDELIAYNKERKPLPAASVLQARRNRSGMYADKNGWQFLSAEEVDEIEKSQGLLGNNDVKGTVAYKGVVKGICRIIKDFRNAELNEGDILVTGMTDPQFVPLMKKAAAIVTDGGGMLCHAAIVAREMKKPCIIGTKNATKILKDGMMVEVDAEKGVVRILK